MPGSRDDRNEPQNDTTGLPAADLLIDHVRIQNFRNLADVTVRLEETTTFLVGENNTGKSSLLLAIHSACGGRSATIDDLFMNEDGRRAEEAIVDIVFRSKNSSFNDHLTSRLSRHVVAKPDQVDWSGFRTKFVASNEGPFLITSRTFLQGEPKQENWTEIDSIVGRPVLQLFETNYIRESRDLSDDLTRKTSDWNKVLSNLDIKGKERTMLEKQLDDLAQQINSESSVIEKIAINLNKLSKYQSEVDSVNLESIPTNIEEIARSINITITNINRKLPLRYQGLGSRSFASLLVYISLLEIVGSDQGIRPHIITLLEEPEAHLHPQAQVSVRRLFEEFPGQTIISTHSNILIGEIPPSSIRLHRSSKTGIKIHTIDIDGAKKYAIFRRYVERPLGEIFFARLVVFVDGTAERITLPVLLEHELGKVPSGSGITFVDMEGMKKEQLGNAVDALRILGDIPWLVFVDNDKVGWKEIEGVKGRDGIELFEGHYQVVCSGSKQLEQMLLDAKYDPEIQDIATEYDPYDPRDPRYGEPRLEDYNKPNNRDYLSFLQDNKGWVGELIAKKAVENGREVPEPVRKLAKAIIRELEKEGDD